MAYALAPKTRINLADLPPWDWTSAHLRYTVCRTVGYIDTRVDWSEVVDPSTAPALLSLRLSIADIFAHHFRGWRAISHFSAGSRAADYLSGKFVKPFNRVVVRRDQAF
jgi:hypothetical protein